MAIQGGSTVVTLPRKDKNYSRGTSALKAKSRRGTSLTRVEICGFVLTSVLTRPIFEGVSRGFTYEKRRGRESNPRIAVLQTATLPLGYPADIQKRQTIPGGSVSVNYTVVIRKPFANLTT